MKNFIKARLLEALASPSFKLPKKFELEANALIHLKNLSWRDISITNTGDDGVSTLYMKVDIKDINYIHESIVFTIQLLQDTYYQPHLFMAPNIQGIGLGPKILKAFIMEYGHLYAGKGRTLNPDADKMLSKLFNDPNLESYSDEHGVLILTKNNPKKAELMKIIQN
jgi:hypothetical protein